MTQYYSQCLFYALNKWHKEGGYIKYGKSVHWCMPHVLHESIDGVTTHFAPESDLKRAWYSIAGFKGRIYQEDKDALRREPIPLTCILIGTLILLLFGGIWAANRIIRKTYDICRKR